VLLISTYINITSFRQSLKYQPNQ